ncbi:MAG: fibrobacter succinogenes major paralogous domain-containing protein, partial [Chitinispirillales bacterium]|nr:fibrobacter succinogenes major paralogous domain-containing protein [Chitinispirillales bacterium]
MIINNRNLRALLLASALCLALVWLSLAAAQSPGGAGTFTDSRDGKTYNTVKIGKQTWMAENLNYGTSSGSWCYNDRDSYCKKYGRLYEWETAKKTCPSGWHLPSRQEWEALVTYAGGYEAAGKRLKSTIGWNDSGSGTDDYGFSALPGGGRYY